ncbi:MAG: HpcH/HpaI aldolase/citrate lyase family protein [Polyangiales bacterium]
MKTTVPLQGACLYVPAVHRGLDRVLRGEAVPGLRQAVVCLEDAVAEAEVPAALARLRGVARCPSGRGPRVFVRPRDPAMLLELLAWPESAGWDGFALPKVTVATAAHWLGPLAKTRFAAMPIFETAEVFDPYALRDLCAAVEAPAWRDRVEVVRIGGADLFAALGARRPAARTVYDSVLGPTVRAVAALLMSRGLHVTAPVWEGVAPSRAMREEVAMDVEAGLVGKTAIHPRQVPVIDAAFRVSPEELAEAERVLAAGEAVFLSRGAMCERAPHARWAARVVARASAFGVAGERAEPARA